MENDKISNLKIRLLYVAMLVFTGVIVFAFSFFTDKSYEAILRNTIVSVAIAGTVVFMLVDAVSDGQSRLLYDNNVVRNRFVVGYFVTLILACVFSLIPNVLWPYMSLFVMLALFSNTEIGMISGVGLVSISVMLEKNGGCGELFMYILAGAVAIAMFRNLEENTEIGIPTFISLMMQAVFLVAYNVLFLNRTFSAYLLVSPAINIMLNLTILLIFLNIFGVYVIRRTNDMYMVINDADFPLLVTLKENNKDEYYRAIHTAYIAERIALGLNINARAVKNCSYYHRIGVLEGKSKWDDVKHIYTDNSFPTEAMDFLHDYIEPKKNEPKSKETLAVQLGEVLIASIMYLLKKDKDAKIDYDNLIDSIIDKKVSDGDLKDYDVTFRELEVMKKIMKKEKLYYDFLR